MKLYQAEWCPFSHRVRAKLTELGIDYKIVNVSASGKNRAELENLAGTSAIPVLLHGERVITDSGEAISYLEQNYETDLEELKLHRREFSPTVYGTLPFEVDEAISRLREALRDVGIEVLEELDLSGFLADKGAYKVLLAADQEFLRRATEMNPGAAMLALLKLAVYEYDGLTCVDAIEPEKGVSQIRDPVLNDQGLELRKRFIKTIKALERSKARAS